MSNRGSVVLYGFYFVSPLPRILFYHYILFFNQWWYSNHTTLFGFKNGQILWLHEWIVESGQIVGIWIQKYIVRLGVREENEGQQWT